MHIEDRLAEISTVLKAIHVALTSGAAVASAPAPTAIPAPAAAAKKEPAPAPKKEPAPAPTPAPAAAKKEGPDFDKDVMPLLKQLVASAQPGHGRQGLIDLLKHFGLKDGSKVPDLAALDRAGEVLEYVKALLAPKQAEDDLGI